MKVNTKGFTLIELLVVIAIIGILASVILTAVNSSRIKANDVSVRENLNTVRTQSIVYYDSNNGYNTASNGTTTACSGLNTLGMFNDPNINAAVREAGVQGGGTTSCVAGVHGWGVAANLKSASSTYWCVDSRGIATSTTNSTPVNATSGNCQ